MKSKILKYLSGFTLMELLATLTVMAIIAAVLVPVYTASQRKGRDDNAIARAKVLDIAKTALLDARGAARANTLWMSATDEQAKYDLLKPYMTGPEDVLGEGLNGGEYTPVGYVYELGYLLGPTSVKREATGEYLVGPGGDMFQLIVGANGSGIVSGSGYYKEGTKARATAQPQNGFKFVNWTGDVPGDVDVTSSAINVLMDADRTITANFSSLEANQYALTTGINIESAGSIALNPSGGTYTSGTDVTLTATAAAGYVFDRWVGEIDLETPTDNSITVTMDRNRWIQANFMKPNVTLTLNVGSGTGTVTGGGVYQSGTYVPITATPGNGFQFSKWTGDFTGSNASDNVLVDKNMTISAQFVAKPVYTLQLGVSPDSVGAGNVTIDSSSPTYPVATSILATNLIEDSLVNIVAIADTNTVFSYWSDDTSDSNPKPYRISSTSSSYATLKILAPQSGNIIISAIFGEKSGGTSSGTSSGSSSGTPVKDPLGIYVDVKPAYLQWATNAPLVEPMAVIGSAGDSASFTVIQTKPDIAGDEGLGSSYLFQEFQDMNGTTLGGSPFLTNLPSYPTNIVAYYKDVPVSAYRTCNSLCYFDVVPVSARAAGCTITNVSPLPVNFFTAPPSLAVSAQSVTVSGWKFSAWVITEPSGATLTNTNTTLNYSAGKGFDTVIKATFERDK